jgi:hypothetical protein
MNRQLIVQTLRGVAPLLVWAVHFGVCYVLVGMVCSPALYDAAAPRRTLLIAFTALAVGACAWMLWRSWRGLGAADEATPLRAWAAAGSALLALAGVLWTAMPVLMLDGCG